MRFHRSYRPRAVDLHTTWGCSSRTPTLPDCGPVTAAPEPEPGQLFIVVGLPEAGKTTRARSLARRRGGGCASTPTNR